MNKKKILIVLLVVIIALVVLFIGVKNYLKYNNDDPLSMSEAEIKRIIDNSYYKIQDKSLANEYKKIKDLEYKVSLASSSASSTKEAKNIFDNFVEERTNYYNKKVEKANDSTSYFRSRYLGCVEEEYYYLFTTQVEYKIKDSYGGAEQKYKYAVIVLKDKYINETRFNTANLSKKVVESIGDVMALVGYNDLEGGRKLIKSYVSENADEYTYTAYYASYEPEGRGKDDKGRVAITISTQYTYYLKKITLRVNKSNGTTNLDISKFGEHEDRDSYYVMDNEIVNSYRGETYA